MAIVTTSGSGRDLASLAESTETFRPFDRERDEGVNAFRGLLFGLIFSIPPGLAVLWGLSHLVGLIS